MLEISLLGQFEIRWQGQPVELPSRPAQSLLAYLLLRPGAAHRREMLAGLLWPDATEANARGYLRQALWRVRKALAAGGAEYILADDLTIAFDASAEYRLDCAALEHDAAGGTTEELMRSAAAYRGELLPGFYGEWVTSERERLQAVFENQMSRLLDRLVTERRWPEVLEWGERWIALSHAPEPAYRALMMAHHGLGDRARVAAVYARCVEALRRELDVEPSEPTRSLYAQLSRDHPAGARAPGMQPIERKRHVATVPQGELPRQLTRFIGREHETAEVRRLLAASQARLVTLTGVGGSGKTRLALEVCRAVLADYPHGAWFVELGPLSDPALVAKTVAATLGLLEESGRPILATLIDSLRAKRCLLILDNCEHLVEAAAQLTEALLRACPELYVLASSREALGIAGETVFRVPPLSVPDGDQAVSSEAMQQYDAVRLFVERASAALPGFAVTADNAPAIARICLRLDGLPLAIELAAARVNLLRPEQIAARLNDRFRLLTGGSRTAVPRHQTLRATMDWSYNLLSDAERHLLGRLSVFAGGWTLEAAEAVCGDAAAASAASPDVLDLLSQLENKSLVVAEPERGLEARYRLLETIRQYAREKLFEAGEGEAIRDRHLDYFLRLSERAEPELAARDQAAWLNRLESELDNLRTALEWALEGSVDAGLRLASALWRFCDAHGHTREGIDWLGQCLARPEGSTDSAARAKGYATRAVLLATIGELAEARAMAAAGLALYRAQGDPAGEAFSLWALGQAELLHGDIVSARPLLEASLALYRASGDRLGQSEVLSWLGLDRRDPARARTQLEESLASARELGHMAGAAGILVALSQHQYWQGDNATPQAWLEEALDIQRQLNSKSGQAWVLECRGYLAFRQGEYAQARAFYEESLALNDAAGLRFANLWTRAKLAHVLSRERRTEQARALLGECLQRFHEARIDIGVVYSVEVLASLHVAEGRPDRAVRLLAWADAVRRSVGEVRPPVEQQDLERDLAVACAELGEARYAAAYAAGQAFTMEEALAEA